MPGAWRSLPLDLRGSVHIFETLLVAVLVAGAVVAVATLHESDENPHENLLPQDPRQTQDVLDVHMELPTQSTHIHHTNRLEEMIVEHLKDKNDPNSIETPLVQQLRRHQSGAEHRLQLHVDGHQIQVTGDDVHPQNNPSSATAMWNSRLGTTLIQPTMSHHDPTMMVQSELLPVWADRISYPAGRPYEVSLELEADDGDDDDDTAPLSLKTASHYREPRDRQTILLVEPVDAQGGPQAIVPPEPLDLDLDTTEWDVHFQITPHVSHGAPWLNQETGLRLHRPPGWDPPAYNETQWQRENPEEDPVWEMRYIGTPQAEDDGVHWFNLTFPRSALDPPATKHPVTLQADGESWSQATVLLAPEETLQANPLVVYANIPHPIPTNTPAPLRFLITNPSDEDQTLSRFQVHFDEAAHQFKHEPTGWQRERESEGVTYTLADGGDHVVAGKGAMTVELPMKLAKTDGNTVLQGHPPIIEDLGAGEQTPSTIDGYHGENAMTSIPHGTRGHSFAWHEPQSVEPGPHTLRVPYNEELRIPPGVATYQTTLDPHPFLRDLQQARNTMHLDVQPDQIRPGDDVTVRLDTTGLMPLLRQSPSLEDDRVQITITTSDLIGRITGTHETQIEYDLDLEWNARITGLAWMPLEDGQGTHDLVVGYSDGRLARLDGAQLPNQTHWRQTIADTITAGPYWLDGGDGGEGQIAVFVQEGPTDPDSLLLLRADGTQHARLGLGGHVHKALVTDCQDGPEGIAFLLRGSTSGGGAPTGDYGAIDASQTVTWTRLEHYQSGSRQQSATWTATRPVDLALGQHGPWAECSATAGINNTPVEGEQIEGTVLRYDLESLKNQWQETVPGGVGSLHAAPVGTPHYDGRFNEAPIDRLVVVNTTGSWRVHGAYTHDAAVNGQIGWQELEDGHSFTSDQGLGTMPGLPPGDTLIGMSWVNHTTGYLASAGGIVWETKTAGNEWVLMDESPIVMPGQELVDFAFGGDGTGLFLREDGRIREYSGSFGTWEANPWGANNFFGLAETKDGPGYIRKHGEFIHLVDWKTSNAFFNINCNCSTAFGNLQGLIGWDDDSVYTNTSQVNHVFALEKIGINYMMQSDGKVIEFTHEGFEGILVHDGDDKSAIELDRSIVEDLGSVAAPSRNPFNSFFVYNIEDKNGVLGLGDDGLPINIPAPRSDTGVVGLSGGLGQTWWVLEDSIIPMSAPDRYLFVLKRGSTSLDTGKLQLAKGLNGSDSDAAGPMVQFLDPGEVPENVQWRFVSSLMVGPWKLLDEESEIPDEEDLVIEIKWPIDDGFPMGFPVFVGISDEEETQFSAQGDQECQSCLIPVGDRRVLEAGGPIWLDPEGYLPGNQGSGWKGGGVLAQQEEEEYFLTGAKSEFPWSHNVSLGLPWRELVTSNTASGDHEDMEFQVINRQGADLLVGEESKKDSDKENYSGGNPIEFYGVEGILYHLDPSTGAIDCQLKTGDVDQDNRRVLQHHPNSQFYGMGSGFGQLSALSNNCDPLWKSEALETGAILHTTVPSSRSPLPGPVVVDVDVTLDVEALDEVQLHFMGHSFRSNYGGPVSPVWMNAHLQYWLPPVHEGKDSG